jgi:hypothetical protein
MLSAEDQAAIQQLYARYNHAIDSGRAEEWAACFTPTGIFNSSVGGASEGKDALVTFAKGFAAQLPKARHWTNNLVIEGAPGGAKGSCYLMLLNAGTQPASVIATGLYRDELVKTGSGWLFSKRDVRTDA